jgi:protein gp37
MGEKTKIDWTDSTWNPLRGCSRVSEGCRNCYAERMAARFSGQGQPYEGLTKDGHWTGKVELVEKHLLDPLKWGSVDEEYGVLGGNLRGRRRHIFVNSMSDLFHKNITDEMRDRIFAVMALCPQHIFQVLTKQPERMLAYLTEWITHPERRRVDAILSLCDAITDTKTSTVSLGAAVEGWKWPLPNVWLGVSVENQAAADERIPLLLQTPAAVMFVSCEPLLGPVKLTSIKWETRGSGGPAYVDVCGGTFCTVGGSGMKGPKLDWAICGGESGPGARPMHPDWARSLRDQCQAAGMPFFFKSWGEYLPVTDASVGLHVVEFDDQKYLKCGKKAAGSLLDGREWKQFPEVNQ